MLNNRISFKIIERLIKSYGLDVIITPITKTTSNNEGDETLTSGTNYTANVYITLKSEDWSFDVAGLIKGGNAVMLSLPDTPVKKDDIVTFNGNQYRIQDIIERSQVGGQVMFRTSNLFLI